MSLTASIRQQLTPIHREGYPFIGGFALASLVLFWIWPPLGWLGVIATLWCIYFFRDPSRVTPIREGLVVAPADGRVCQVVSVVPPRELDLGERPLPRISIFMSVFDCHINRSPVGGHIQRIGMIRFGSRVDVYLPEGAHVLAGEGQIAIAGETLIADLAAGAAEPTFQRE